MGDCFVAASDFTHLNSLSINQCYSIKLQEADINRFVKLIPYSIIFNTGNKAIIYLIYLSFVRRQNIKMDAIEIEGCKQSHYSLSRS